MMTEAEFDRLATATLGRIAETLEEALGGGAEVDFQGGIVTVSLDEGGEYVINKHAPNRQIWLSSPVSGAAHFAFDAASKAWISTRSNRVLGELLAEELGPVAKRPLDLG